MKENLPLARECCCQSVKPEEEKKRGLKVTNTSANSIFPHLMFFFFFFTASVLTSRAPSLSLQGPTGNVWRALWSRAQKIKLSCGEEVGLGELPLCFLFARVMQRCLEVRVCVFMCTPRYGRRDKSGYFGRPPHPMSRGESPKTSRHAARPALAFDLLSSIRAV